MFFDKKKIENFETISFDHLIVELKTILAITLKIKKKMLNSKIIEELLCTVIFDTIVKNHESMGYAFEVDLTDFKDSKNQYSLNIAQLNKLLYLREMYTLVVY